MIEKMNAIIDLKKKEDEADWILAQDILSVDREKSFAHVMHSVAEA
jgi:hypothetical protein